MSTDKSPPALPHGELREMFDDVFFVSGAIRMGGSLPMSFSRNMTVVRHDGALTIINSMRLDEAGLTALEALGEVRHVLRIAGFHGRDDAFYHRRYGADVTVLEGMRYLGGFKTEGKPYFTPQHVVKAGATLPFPDARLLSIESASPSEGLVLLERDGGVLIAGDSLQNWAKPDAYFSFPARLVMRGMGFIKPFNVGPGWLKGAKPDVNEVARLLELPFEHLLPAHGVEVIGDAREKYRPALERLRR